MRNNYSLQQLKSGNEIAYRELYEVHREAFIHFALKYGLTKNVIIDIYQDAFIVLYENITSGKLTELSSSIKTYLFSIGKYKIMEELRANKKVMIVDHFPKEQVMTHMEYSEEILSGHQKLLKANFSKLGARCQNILQLFYIQGLTIKDITASENYENENTVKAQKSRCLKKLKQLINPKSS